MAEHKNHTWRGFRGGLTSFQMCIVCGKKKDIEDIKPVATYAATSALDAAAAKSEEKEK
jgi:hypothetical protein